MNEGDKVICKKEICWKIGRWHDIFLEGELCTITKINDYRTNPLMILIDGKQELISNELTIIINEDFAIDEEIFNDRFYNPEETKNVLRLKMIDKMLKNK